MLEPVPALSSQVAAVSPAAGKIGRDHIKDMVRHCAQYVEADNRKAVIQVINTLPPFLVVCAVMLWAYHGMYWLTVLLSPIAAGLLVRLFIIQHDRGHGSFFTKRVWNNRLGRIMSVLTWTPYDFWRKTHNLHHASSGNLDGRGFGSIETVTVKEYAAMSARQKFLYRFYRNPFVMMVMATPFFIVLVQRVPLAEPLSFAPVSKRVGFQQIWKSVMGLNLVLLLVYGGLCVVFGFGPVLMTYLPVVALTACMGGWLFYIQHQFEDAHWEKGKDWDYHEAAVMGSSYYDLPKIIQWFTGNIGLHHIHHLNAKIPNYRLQECLDAHQGLKTLNRITFWESLKYARLALWCEERRKMVGFAGV